MSEFKVDEYYEIATQFFRPETVVSFDVYLRLNNVDHILLYVRQGDPFPIYKLERLRRFDRNKLYIRNDQRLEYFKYLEKYFDTPGGKILHRALREQHQASPIPGFPSDDEYTFSFLQNEKKVA